MHAWRLVAVACVAFGGCGAPKAPESSYQTFEISGVLANEDGAPASDAELAVCDCDTVGCNDLRTAMFKSQEPPSRLWARFTKDEGFGTVTFLRTDRSGRWAGRATLCGDQQRAYAWAPGRVVAEIPFRQLVAGPRTTLARAASLTVEIPCRAERCGRVALVMDDHRGNTGVPDLSLPPGPRPTLTLYGLPAGRHSVTAFQGEYEAGEHEGRGETLLHAGDAARLEIEMKPTGTGDDFVGTLHVDEPGDVLPNQMAAQGVRIDVEVQCRHGERDRVRKGHVEPGSGGRFTIPDRTPGTCRFYFTKVQRDLSWPLCSAPGDDGGPTRDQIFVRSARFCPPPPQHPCVLQD